MESTSAPWHPPRSNYLYSANIHERFMATQVKGATTSKILHKDNSGSEILVKGPHAPDVDSVIAAAKRDLESKLLVAAYSSDVRREAGWMPGPISKTILGAGGEAPLKPCRVGAAVHVTVMAV